MTPHADVRFETIGRVVVARIEGEIDMSNAGGLGTAITGRVTSDALGVVLHLGAVDYLDSAGIQVVFELRERLSRRGQQIRLVLPPGSPVASALHYADVPRTFGVAETEEAAIADVED